MRKKYLFILVILIGLSSCVPKQLIDVSSGHDASITEKGNFILFKNGREMKLPDNLNVKSGLLNLDKTRKIKINDTKYPVKEIVSIQVDGEYFVNIGKKQFVKRIYHGPLNVFNRFKTNTTSSYNGASGMGGPGARWSSNHTYISTEYFVQKDSLNKGEVLKFSGVGKQKKLMPYVSDYAPSKNLLIKYQHQRTVSRIAKFAVAAEWVASAVVFASTKDGSSLNKISGYNFLAGIIYVPVFSMTFKYGNHKRPYGAVQSYIDNNFLKEGSAKASSSEDTSHIVSSQSDTSLNFAGSVENTKRDFIILNNNQQIIADSGTKLLIANNRNFLINNHKYSTEVSAFQFKKKFYKRLPDEKMDFGLKVISGKISMYQYSKAAFGNSYTAYGIKNKGYSVGPIGIKRDKPYFEKEGEGPMVKDVMKMDHFFADDPNSLKKYVAFKTYTRNTKLISYGLSAITLGSIVGMFASINKTNYSLLKDPFLYTALGSSILNVNITINRGKKLFPKLMSVVKGYNRTKEHQ